MTITEALAALDATPRGNPAVRQMRDTAARCQESQSGSISRYIRPTSPAMRVLFDALFVAAPRKPGGVKRLSIRKGQDAARILAALTARGEL